MNNHEKIHSQPLACLVEKIAQNDGDYNTAIPALMIYRRSSASEPMPCIYGLGIGVTVQGGKRVTLGNEIYDYGPSQSLVTSVDLPVVSYVTKASKDEPYIGVRLELDARMISQLAADIELPNVAKDSMVRAISVVKLDEGVENALARLIMLLDEPSLISQVAPLIIQEIAIRLIKGEHGSTLRHLVTLGTPSHQIAKVMTWLKLNFSVDLSMDDLAAKAHMSPTTFRQHFRAIAGMSPLQYLKNLRLQEARQLMMNNNLDAGSAAVQVGYESASQFSREYSRLFGEPPHRDISRIKS